MANSEFGKIDVEIIYCVSWGYFPVATWMAAEFLSSQNPGDIALTITPADKGRLEVYIQNEKIYDCKVENTMPDFIKVKELQMLVIEKLFES